MDRTNIYLIRHGRQNSRLCNVDVALSAEGVRQAELLGRRLADRKIDMVYSSDYLRALETAETANRYWNAPLEVLPELREIDFGEMTGLSDAEIAERFADFKREFARMERDLPYPGGECAGDVIRRAYPALLRIAQGPHHDVAVITHGGVIRSLAVYLLGADPAGWRRIGRSLENTGITELRYYRNEERFTVERLNDAAHLEDYPELLREKWIRTEN